MRLRSPRRQRVVMAWAGLSALFWIFDGAQAAEAPGSKQREDVGGASGRARARIGNDLLRIIEANTSDPYGPMAMGQSIPMRAPAPGGDEARIAVLLEPWVRNGFPQIDEALVEDLGAEVDAISRSYMRAYVPVSKIKRLAEHPDVAVISAPIGPVPTDYGTAVSEGVALTGASDFHDAGITGAGVRMAVLDSDFVGLNEAIAAGELPEDTIIVDLDGSGLNMTRDHGTRVAEHIMDMAPDVEIHIMTPNDVLDLENAADYIRDNDIQLLSMSLGWAGHSFFDDTGPVTTIFNELHDLDGVFSSVAASNEALSHWRGGWTDVDEDNYLEFALNDSYMRLSVASGTNMHLYLSWNQFDNSETDLDLYLVAANGDGTYRTVDVSTGFQNGPQKSFEWLSYTAQQGVQYSARVRWARGTLPPDLDIRLHGYGVYSYEHRIAASSITDPAVGHGVFAVGAVDQADWEADNPPLESFSSRGPSSDGRLKPDIVAPDRTTCWTGGPVSASGTSFAAPHLGGAAALLFSEDLSRTALEVAERLRSRARDTGEPGPDNSYGYGRVVLVLGDPPVTVDDVAQTDEDTPVDIAPLLNDSDPDGETISLSGVLDPAHGTVTLNPDDTFTYIPNADFNGEEILTYAVEDELGLESQGTVVVTVNPIQDAPRPQDDHVSTPPNVALLIDVLANDVEPDGEAMALTGVGVVANGVAVNNGDDTITYTPNPGFEGMETFEYTVADPQDASASALVEVWVSDQNRNPVGVDDQATVMEDQEVTINVLVNDYDHEGDALSITRVVSTTHGTATISAPDSILFRPDENYFGVALIEYELQDDRGGVDTAQVTITVEPIENFPVGIDDNVQTPMNQPVVIDVLANDYDVDGDPLTAFVVRESPDGTTVENGDGTFTFTPDLGFLGDTSFVYWVSDGTNRADSATVRISVVSLAGRDWIAYNDLNSSNPESANAPNVTENDPDFWSGTSLRNYETGEFLPVSMDASTEGGWTPTINGGDFFWSSEAEGLFNGIVDGRGVDELGDPSWTSTVTFEDLDPTKTYVISLTANRGNSGYANSRYTRVTIEGADSFTNASTEGVVVHSDASVSFSTGYNSENGYVARWTDIRAFSGTFSVVSQWNNELGSGSNSKGYAMSMFRLEQWTPEPSPCDADADCIDGNLCTDDVCNPATLLCENPNNAAPCDDGVACTVDHCSEGICVGAPTDALCDDDDVCTRDRCDEETGCEYADDDGVSCDDGLDCTTDDICNDQACVGVDTCDGATACDWTGGMCVATPTEVTFRAFNDLAWEQGQPQANITTLTSPNGGSGLASAGELVDFETGAGTGVTLTVTGGTYNGDGGTGRTAPAWSDAGTVFGGAVDTLGTVAYLDVPDSPFVLTFTGLNPDRLYRLVYHCDRAGYGWDRDSMVTMVGAASFRNRSTDIDEEEGPIYFGASDPDTRLPADNPNGYVARFTEVDPGPDGEVVLSVIESFASFGNTGKYGSAVLIEELSGRCSQDAHCTDGNVCTDDTCDLDTGDCVTTFNDSPCDDGVACTIGDQCGDGACVGTPDNALCDDQNLCTDDICDPAVGCEISNNAAACDDGVACTVDDVCADGSCSGTASCPPGEMCDVGTDVCVPEPDCMVDTDCDDGNICTDNTCDGQTSQCVTTLNQAPCDDGVACTDGEQCSDGQCQIGAPNHGACNDDNVCTDDVCDVGAGCMNTPNVDACDDGLDCTHNDLCADGTCAGQDACPVDQACDAGAGECRATERTYLFKAYNDLAWRDGQLRNNITTASAGGGRGRTANLIDYATGQDIGVLMTIVGGVYDGNYDAGVGRDAPPGTDAGDVFGGIVDTQGTITYVNQPNSPLELIFTGLDPDGRYEIVFHSDRGAYGWDRPSSAWIQGVSAYTNESSEADDNWEPEMDGALFWGPDDVTTTLPADNTDGYVARFSYVAPGPDGEFTLSIDATWFQGYRVEDYRGKYASAVMLAQIETGCRNDAQCDDDNVCTDDTCNVATGECSTVANQAACDDGVACTVDDQCVEGACGGTTDDGLCDDTNLCTDDLCRPGTGCENSANAAQCDDGLGCTVDDICADGLCSGSDTCPGGESCDVATGECVPAPECQVDADCDDGDVCTAATCDAGVGVCIVTFTFAQCDDGLFCTLNDRCADGICQAGLPDHTACFDYNDCTDEVCNIVTGCEYTNNSDPCNDDIFCTQGDVCTDGACAGGPPDDGLCTDDNSCTDDVCDVATGCVYTNNIDPCDDGAACTQNDVCGGGTCTGADTCLEGMVCDLNMDMCQPAAPEIAFRAYNDLGWRGGQSGDNLTNITTPGAGLPSSGGLLDHETGEPTGITFSVSGGRYDTGLNGGDGRNVAPGTDAGDIFGGIVNTEGAIAYVNDPGSPLVLSFTDLNPDATYAIAFYGDREYYSWDRASLVTITGADAFINASSTADDNPAPGSGGALFSGADDPATRLPADNGNGYVARFTEVRSGADGAVDLVISADGTAGNRGKYANAIMIEQRTTRCSADAECDDGNVCTDDTCQGAAGCAHTNVVGPCDDGVACTDNDVCADGACGGEDACIEGMVCDHDADACFPAEAEVVLSAYNDLAWRDEQVNHNITHITAPGSGLPNSGELVDYGTGAGTGIMLAVSGAWYDGWANGDDGRSAPAGSDAGDIFGGIVDTMGAVAYVNDINSPLVLTFTGLDPEAAYVLVFHGDRGRYDWDRASLVNLTGADAFTNESSAAVDNPAPGSNGALFSGPDDPSTRVPANNPNGYVARFTDVEPGADGEVVLVIEADGNSGARGKYGSAVMIQQLAKGCQVDADCDDGNACTVNTCNVETTVCTDTPIEGACDDGIACSTNDQCVDGVCQGGVLDDDQCDDNNACTDDVCELDSGCVAVNNAGPCDDGLACTIDDVCSDGACAGADTCPDGQSCDADTDQCVEGGGGGDGEVLFRAFNDLAWGRTQLTENITLISSPNGGSAMPSTGALIDHESGDATEVTLTVAGGRFNGGGHAYDGENAPVGTDAGDLFDGIVSTWGAVAYVSEPDIPLVLTFSGLRAGIAYTLVLHGNRGAYGWNRASLATLGGAATFTNASSDADDNPAPGSGGALFSGPDDASTRLPADNPNGYVARFTNVTAGESGTVTLTLTSDGNSGGRGKYASAVMVEAVAAGCAQDGDCEDNNLCTDNTCDPITSVCVSVNNADPCDDGVACTIDDICDNGMCAGIESCPEGSQCDFETAQCIALPNEDWTAYNDFYWSGDLNAANTTGHDYEAVNEALVDFATGDALPVTLTGTIVGGYDPQWTGGDASLGTEADAVFGGIVSQQGAFELDAPHWQNIMTFENLDPNKRYTVVLSANRNSGSYTNARFTRVTLTGADTFNNASTDGVVVNGPDSVSLSTGNNAQGYVARWTDVTAADGTFSVMSEWDDTQGGGRSNTKGYAMSVVQIIQSPLP